MTTTPATTLERFKEHLNKTNVEDDTELADFILAATGIAEDDLDFGVGAIIERAVATNVTVGSGVLAVPVGPVATVTSLVGVSGDPTVDVGDLDVDAEAGIIRGASTPLVDGRYAIEYTAGSYADVSEVPGDVQLAVCIIGKYLWDTQRGRNNRSGTAAEADQSASGGFEMNRARSLLRSRGGWVSIH